MDSTLHEGWEIKMGRGRRLASAVMWARCPRASEATRGRPHRGGGGVHIHARLGVPGAIVPDPLILLRQLWPWEGSRLVMKGQRQNWTSEKVLQLRAAGFLHIGFPGEKEKEMELLWKTRKDP